MEKEKPGVITIDKFTGGRTNFMDQLEIDPSMCASASQNVWCPNNVLTKAPGMTLQASFTASGSSSISGFWYEDNVSTAQKIFYGIEVSATGQTSQLSFPFASSQTFTDSVTPLGYTVGTVAVGGVSATGSGTLWLANVITGDRFQSSQNTNGWYSVLSVQDDTHLTLAASVPTAVGAGTSYILQPGYDSNSPAEAVLNGKLVISTTGDYQKYYDGSNFFRLSVSSTASTVPPKASFLAVFQNYIFAGYTAAFPSRILWSNLGDPLTWYSNNFIDIDLTVGQITGLQAFGQELIVFKNRGMYKVVGNTFDPTNPTYYVQKITTPPDFIFNSNSSCAIHTTVSPNISYGAVVGYTNSILVFYGGGRIYVYQPGTTFVTRIGDSIINDLPNLSNYFTYNTDQFIRGFSYNGYYILKGLYNTNQVGTLTYLQLIWDRNKSWWNQQAASSGYTDPFGVGHMAVIPSSTNKPQLATSGTGAGSGNGRIYTVNMIGPTYTTSYPGDTNPGFSLEPINGVWTSKEFNIEYGTFNKIIVYLQKQAAGNLTVQWSIDQGTPVSYTVDMTMGRGNVIRAVIDIRQKGSTIQLTLSNNVVSQTFAIYGAKIYYTPSEGERLL